MQFIAIGMTVEPHLSGIWLSGIWLSGSWLSGSPIIRIGLALWVNLSIIL